jgi:hypothetical protein
MVGWRSTRINRPINVRVQSPGRNQGDTWRNLLPSRVPFRDSDKEQESIGGIVSE